MVKYLMMSHPHLGEVEERKASKEWERRRTWRLLVAFLEKDKDGEEEEEEEEKNKLHANAVCLLLNCTDDTKGECIQCPVDPMINHLKYVSRL